MTTRVSVREPASSGGFVDAAWWPASDDLVAELPELLTTFRGKDRDIVHVVFHIGAWQPVPKRATVDGHRIKLGGFRAGDSHTVGLVDSQGKPTIQVLVIPSDTDPDVARRVLDLAATADSTDRPADMLERARTASV